MTKWEEKELEHTKKLAAAWAALMEAVQDLGVDESNPRLKTDVTTAIMLKTATMAAQYSKLHIADFVGLVANGITKELEKFLKLQGEEVEKEKEDVPPSGSLLN